MVTTAITFESEKKRQRALVLQDGGTLGEYEAGAFKALYEFISKKDDGKPFFDIVAGTSIGAINAAILREARGKALTDEMAQHIVKELKPKHPVLASIVESAHQMDIRETIGALIVVEALKKFLRIHAARLATD